MSPERPSSPGIRGIAAALKISIGTVDRALHGRPGVNADTRARVLGMAEKMEYRPNVAARSLKLNRNLRIAVHLPLHIASFFGPLREGIRTAADAAPALRVDVDFRSHPRLGEGDLELLEQDMQETCDGIILAPGNPKRVDPLLRRLASRGIPVVCVNSDAPHSPRLCSVSVNAFVSGGVAAELLAMKLVQKGSVAVVTGNLATEDHAEKLRGFAASLAIIAPHLRLLPGVETHELPEDAYSATLKLLKRNPRLSGIYINTANSLPVLRAIEERRLLGRIQVIATDLFPELIPLIETRAVLATLHQRPFTQGKVAFETLLRYIADRIKPEDSIRLAPHIVLRSNCKLFSAQM